MDITFTNSQKRAYSKLMEFVADKNAKIFILKGYAGTGKTTLMRKLVEEMKARDESFSLLASTGRAAKSWQMLQKQSRVPFTEKYINLQTLIKI